MYNANATFTASSSFKNLLFSNAISTSLQRIGLLCTFVPRMRSLGLSLLVSLSDLSSIGHNLVIKLKLSWVNVTFFPMMLKLMTSGFSSVTSLKRKWWKSWPFNTRSMSNNGPKPNYASVSFFFISVFVLHVWTKQDIVAGKYFAMGMSVSSQIYQTDTLKKYVFRKKLDDWV